MLKENGNFHFSEKMDMNKINQSNEKKVNYIPLEINSSNFLISKENDNSYQIPETHLILNKKYENNTDNKNMNSTSNILNNILNSQNSTNLENGANQNKTIPNIINNNNCPQSPNVLTDNKNENSSINNNSQNIQLPTNKNLTNNKNKITPNKEDSAIYLIDSEDDKEEENNKSNNNNQNENNNINNNSNLGNKYKLNNEKNDSINEDNNEKNNTNNNTSTTNVDIINNNEENNKNVNDGKQNTIQKYRRLFYARKIKANGRAYKGREKLNIQISFLYYDSNEILPNFSFTTRGFFYNPKDYKHISSNNKGYILSFSNLIKTFKEKVIENDLRTLFTYYFRQKRGKQTSLDIKVKDEKTLNNEVFLNDGIVNFYLKMIEDEYTCGEGNANKVLIMKSFFYNSLSNQNSNSNLLNSFYCPDSCSFVRTKINVFSFKTLIIPICESYHWSLIIVNDIDKMKNIFSEKNLKLFNQEFNDDYININNNDNAIEEKNEYPEVFYLDSLFHINQRRMIIIYNYLFYEYQKVYSIKCNDIHQFFKANFNKIECYNVDVPKQNNSYDCGIFVLMYAEMFFYNPEYFLQNTSKKYKINNENEENKSNNINNNNVNQDSNNNIINSVSYNINNNSNNNNVTNINNNMTLNNLINFCNNKNELSSAIPNVTNENINSDNIIKNNINSFSGNLSNNNNIKNNDKNKSESSIIVNNTQELFKNINQIKENENNNGINGEINNNTENSKDNFDIEIESGGNKLDNDENNEQENIMNNNEQNEEMPNADENLQNQNEKSLRNWFSLEMINNQRNKIKNLIMELTNIEKGLDNKKDIETIKMKQNSVIKKYMEMQKKEFDDYFLKLKDSNNNK